MPSNPALYTGFVGGITPDLTKDNWSLDASSDPPATTFGYVMEVGWAGEETASAKMRTLFTRYTSRGNGGVAGDVQQIHARSQTNTIHFFKSQAAYPLLAQGAIFATSWNANGGIVRWIAEKGEEAFLGNNETGGLGFSCRNTVGTGVMSSWVLWKED